MIAYRRRQKSYYFCYEFIFDEVLIADVTRARKRDITYDG